MLNHKKTYKLGDFLFEYSEKNTNGKVTEVYSVGSKGIRKRSEIYGHDLSANYQNYKIIFEKTLTIGMGSKQIDIGIFQEKIHGLVSPAYTTYKIENIKPEYLKNWFIQYTSKISQLYMITGARQGKSVNKVGLLSHPIKVPNYPEQEKIGSFFSAIDRLIEKQKEKVERLNSLNKIYQEWMFPSTDEMSPKFRFHGYSGKWLNSTLKEISTLITKGTSPLDKSFNEEVNYIKIENINDLNGQITITSKISLQEHNGYLKRSQLQDGDLLFSIAGTLGRITLIDKSLLPANTNQALAIIRLKGVSRRFVKIALKGKIIRDFIKRNPTIGAQPNLSLEQVRNLIIHLPGEEEQNHIAYFFELFEKLTQKEQSLLEKYLELKQSYLQKIFAD